MITRSKNRESYHDLINRNKLKGLMREHNITQSGLADELGLAKSQISLKICSKADFSEHEIYLLLQKFGTDIFLT